VTNFDLWLSLTYRRYVVVDARERHASCRRWVAFSVRSMSSTVEAGQRAHDEKRARADVAQDLGQERRAAFGRP
jgi:hypothetical protein